MNKTKKELAFIEYVKGECKKYGVKCKLKSVKYVKMDGNVKCSGWFDEEVPELVVAMNRPDWIEILAHEYGHLTQWRENAPIWKEAVKSLPKVWGWLDGTNVRNIEKHIGISRDLELDNEKRAVKIIKKFELKVDLEHYVKKANAYVQFYNWMLITRKWSKPTNSPYKNKNLVEAMSSKFNMKYDKLTPKLENIFRTENI
jgi:hypothetical protein